MTVLDQVQLDRGRREIVERLCQAFLPIAIFKPRSSPITKGFGHEQESEHIKRPREGVWSDQIEGAARAF